jgi:hypothetical protein
MTSRGVFEKKCESCKKQYHGCGRDEFSCYSEMLEEQSELMLEALKAIDEAITDNCISDAQMMIKNIIKQVSGEQEG